MKYEYLKGSEKDFEGAPEWATHVIEHKEGNQRAFAEKFDYMCRAVYAADAEFYPDSKTVIANPTMWIVIADRGLVDVEVTGKKSWNGVGLPPVGYECEFTFGPYDPDEFDGSCGEIPKEGSIVKVVAHKTTSHGNKVAVVYWDDAGAGRAMCLIGPCLKPIRSEADRKREKAIIALAGLMPDVTPFKYGDKMSNGDLIGSAWYELYDAIAAGKIPGVKLED